jgi:hypothetical protein
MRGIYLPSEHCSVDRRVISRELAMPFAVAVLMPGEVDAGVVHARPVREGQVRAALNACRRAASRLVDLTGDVRAAGTGRRGDSANKTLRQALSAVDRDERDALLIARQEARLTRCESR